MKLSRLRRYVHDHGLRSSVVLTVDRLLHREIPEIDYSRWLQRNRPSSREYDRMEKAGSKKDIVFGVTAAMDEKDKTAFFQSLEMQVYHNFMPLKKCPEAEYVLVVCGPASLRPDLLFECTEYLDRSGERKPDLIYFDSDHIDEDGCKGDPSFRPEYDPDLLSRVNYMGSVILVRGQILRQIAPPSGTEEALHTFLKKVCQIDGEQVSGSTEPVVLHIPKILFHEVRTQAYDDRDKGAKNVQSSSSKPLISVIIPNKDHKNDLDRCIHSLLHVNTWDHLEILIIENNSTQQETWDYYDEVCSLDQRIRVLTWEGAFNYSAINNYGIRNAAGEYVLLLNNDTRVIGENSLAVMAGLVKDPGVGAVGALLLYPNGNVQHAGIILGHGGIAGHAWENENPERIAGTLPKQIFFHTHNVSAVTGACMMMRKSVYEKAGGLDESLEVTFNDVDLCLRLRKMGLRILMCPDALLMHYESASRGSEDSPQKVKRFHKEISIFVHRYETELRQGDPFYNPNLTLIGKSWTCRDDVRETAKPYLKYLNMEVEEGE